MVIFMLILSLIGFCQSWEKSSLFPSCFDLDAHFKEKESLFVKNAVGICCALFSHFNLLYLFLPSSSMQNPFQLDIVLSS